MICLLWRVLLIKCCTQVDKACNLIETHHKCIHVHFWYHPVHKKTEKRKTCLASLWTNLQLDGKPTAGHSKSWREKTVFQTHLFLDSAVSFWGCLFRKRNAILIYFHLGWFPGCWTTTLENPILMTWVPIFCWEKTHIIFPWSVVAKPPTWNKRIKIGIFFSKSFREWNLQPGKLAWQWKTNHLKMHLLLNKNGDFPLMPLSC